MPVLGAEGDVQRRGHADVVILGDVELAGPLAEDEVAGMKIRRCRAGIVEKRHVA